MKNNFLVALATFGMATILFTGCSKLPQAEIDAATAAIEEAKTAGAETYNHDNFFVLQDSLNGVMLSVEAQKSKFMKNYADEKEQLAGLTLLAQKVTQETEEIKAALKIQILANITEIEALIATNKQLILQAPKGKEGTSALLAIKGEITTIEESLGEVSTLVESGDYLEADQKALAAKGKASSINEELSAVIAKYKANVRNR